MAIPVQEDDLESQAILNAENPPPAPAPVTTTATPTPQPAPAAPGGATPPAGNTPPWLQKFRTAQDTRRTDFRNGMDAFYGGFGKILEGDLKGGFGQWREYGDTQRDARRARFDERLGKMGEHFKMPPGFASKLPWGQQGKPGATPAPGPAGAQGVAPGEPNPSAPKDPSLDTPKQSAPGQSAAPPGTPSQRNAKAGAWWAQGWGGGRGHAYGHNKLKGKPVQKPAKPAGTP
jgi:hypothetical protein